MLGADGVRKVALGPGRCALGPNAGPKRRGLVSIVPHDRSFPFNGDLIVSVPRAGALVPPVKSIGVRLLFASLHSSMCKLLSARKRGG